MRFEVNVGSQLTDLKNYDDEKVWGGEVHSNWTLPALKVMVNI